MEKELKTIADTVNKINHPQNAIIKIALDLSNALGTVANQQKVKIEIIPQEPRPTSKNNNNGGK